MDVRCDRCQTEYEFDENYLTPNGVAVKCTTCGNVFKVRRSITQPLIVTTPVPSTSLPAAPQGENRLSLVRWRAGQTLPLKDVTELQRWVVERKVTRDDEVSFGGEGFRKLGNLPELNSFFQLVDAADRAQLQAAVPPPPMERVEPRPALSPTLINTTPGFPDAPKALGTPALLTPEPAWTGQRRATSPMNMATLVDEELDEDVSRLKGSRMGLWLLALILVGGGGGAAWWYLNNSSPPRPIAKPHPPVPAPAPPTEPVPADTAQPPGTPPPTPEPGAPPGTVPAAAPIPPTAGGPPPVATPDSHAAPPGPTAAPVAAPAPTPGSPMPATPVPPPAAAIPVPSPGPAPVPGPKAEAEVPPSKGAAAAAAATAAAQAPSTQPPTPTKTDFAGYMARGRRLVETRPTDALEMFKKASQLMPSSPEPYAARGLAYTDMQSWDAAIEAFNGALTRNPEFSDAVMGLAEAYRYKGDKEKAQINYQRYLQMAPSGPDARVARVQLEILKGIAPAPQ